MGDEEKKKQLLCEPGQLWAISEAGLNAIIELESANLNPELLGVLTRRGERDDAFAGYETRGEVAIIPIIGPIMRYGGSILSWFMRVATVESLALDFQKAIDDPGVKAIILNIDSPGGMVAGINEMAEIIFNTRGEKPIVSYIGAVGASAAYWLAAATDRIVINETAETGSIGIIARYWKQSANQYEFVNSASPKKNLDPGTDSGRAEIMKTIDAIAEVFIGNIAKYRGVTAETVKTDFGRGGVLVGNDAMNAGLVDEIGSLEGIITELQANINLTRGELKMSETLSRETLEKNFEIIKAQAPDLIESIKVDSEKSGYDKGKADGLIEGEKAERERVTAILGVEDCDPNAQKKAIIEGMAPDAAYRLFFEAEKQKRADGLESLENSLGGENTAGASGKEKGTEAGAGEIKNKSAEFLKKVDEYQAAKNCSRADAMSAIIAEFPDLHKAYIDEANA